jgi:hypothetical protein
MKRWLPVDLVRRAQANLQRLKEQQNTELRVRKMEWEGRSGARRDAVDEEALSNAEQIRAAWPLLAATAKGGRIPSILSRNEGGQWEHTYLIDGKGSIWLSAAEAADAGNPLLLCELLCIEEEVPDDHGRGLIRDLLDRHQPFPAEDQQALARHGVDRGSLPSASFS